MLGVRLSDVAVEVELCHEKWIELRYLAEGLESAPFTSRAKQRVQQSLQHVLDRLRNLETQAGTTETKMTLAPFMDQVAACLLYTSTYNSNYLCILFSTVPYDNQ